MKNAIATAIAIVIQLAAAKPALSVECAALYEREKVMLVVPYRAGGGYDTYARVMAPLLSDIMGTNVSVANISGAGGSMGQRSVAAATNGGIMIGLFNSMNLVTAYSDETRIEDRLENFVTLGMVHREPRAWIAEPDFEITAGMEMFAAVTNLAGSVQDTVLPAHAMGGTMTMVSGYSGSSEAVSALMRGEVNIRSQSLTSSLRAVESNDLKMLFVLSNGFYPGTPEGVPYFAGPGGLVDQMTRDLPAIERTEKMLLAKRTAVVTESMRGLFASKRTAPEMVSCLKTDIEKLIFSDAFKKAATEQRIPITPMSSNDAQALLEDARESVLALNEMVQRIIEEQR